jgi:hypothetical protein
MTPEWLIGFIDGNGYFGLECVKRKRHNKIDFFLWVNFSYFSKKTHRFYIKSNYL